MYAKFWGLRQDPFSIAPDPRYLFMSERHREALAHLLYGLGGGGGFVLLTGEIGTGKTTVCRCFLEQIPANCNVAYIVNPKLSVLELLRSICEEFHIELAPAAATAKDFIDPLNEFLLRSHGAGQNSILIIDEAQNLSADVLEQLRLLTNLETSERKLLQIVLIGQPELRRMLARPELEQLSQRVIARFHLDALSTQETVRYVSHRLAVAGLPGTLPFEVKAMARIHQLSGGVPRRINLLCGRALLGAYATRSSRVDRSIVDKAAAEVFGQAGDNSPNLPLMALNRRSASLAAAGLLGLLAGAVVFGAFPSLHRLREISGLSRQKVADTSTGAGVTSSSTGGLKAPAASRPGALAAPPVDRSSLAVAAALSPASSALGQDSKNPTPLSREAFAARIATGRHLEDEAWRGIAELWGLKLEGTEACAAASRKRAYCIRNRQVPLSLIRDLDRPGVLTLFNAASQPSYAVLIGLSETKATLQFDKGRYTADLADLAQFWRGDFATLWQAPPDYPEDGPVFQTGVANDWLSKKLAGAAGNQAGSKNVGDAQKPLTGEALRGRISEFQLTHGLLPDGKAGPMTLMQLNRVIGISEPRLEKPPSPKP